MEELPDVSEECDQLGITESKTEEWLVADQSLSGAQMLSYGELMEMAQGSSTHDSEYYEQAEPVGPIVRYNVAEECFCTCPAWLEEQVEATLINLILL